MAAIFGVAAALTVALWTWHATRPPRSDGKKQIVVWNLMLMGPSVELALHQFEIENPQYRVVYSNSVSPDTTIDGQRLLTAIAGGVPPDVMMFDRFAIPEWAARVALTELTSFLNRQRLGDPDRIDPSQDYPWTIEEGSYRKPGTAGKAGLFGIPVTVDCRLLFSNANELRQVGSVDPQTGEPRSPRTCKELRDLARRESRGWTHFTPDEQITLLTLWSIARSPLIVGANLPANDAFTLQLLTNDAVIAVDQHSTGNRQVRRTETDAVWSAEMPDSKDRYVALFNISAVARTVGVATSDLGLSARCGVLDLWSGKPMEPVTSSVSAMLPPHGAVLYQLMPKD